MTVHVLPAARAGVFRSVLGRNRRRGLLSRSPGMAAFTPQGDASLDEPLSAGADSLNESPSAEESFLSRAVRLALFLALELLLLPVQALALLFHVVRVWGHTIPRGVSGTANLPLFARVGLHLAGTRPDQAALGLAPHLPGLDSFIVHWGLSFAWAARLCWGLRLGVASKPPLRLLQFPPTLPSSFLTALQHRTAFLDRAMLQATGTPRAGSAGGARQVVTLGSGWDTRAWGLLTDVPVRVYEVDAPATLRAKYKAALEAGLDLGRVTFVECDFETKPWMEALKEIGFDPSVPTFLLWEGVFYYLPMEAAKKALASLASLAPGSSIALDFFSTEFIHTPFPYTTVSRWLLGAALWLYGEEMVSGISTASSPKSHAETFLNGVGLTLTEFELMGPVERPLGGLIVASI